MSALLEELVQLDDERRAALRAQDQRVIGGQGYRWPREVCDLDAHPAKRARRPLVERRGADEEFLRCVLASAAKART